MKYHDEAGFDYIFLDEILLEYQQDFDIYLMGKTVPEPLDGRERAYYHDYKRWSKLL